MSAGSESLTDRAAVVRAALQDASAQAGRGRERAAAADRGDVAPRRGSGPSVDTDKDALDPGGDDREPLYHFVTRLARRGDLRRGRRRARRSAVAAALVAVGVPDGRGDRAAGLAGLGRRVRLLTKGWLPYTLRGSPLSRARLSERIHDCGRRRFRGPGVWTFEQDGACRHHLRLARSRPRSRCFGNLSFLLKPLFEANHRWAMAQGEKSLKLELARRRAASDALACGDSTAAGTGDVRRASRSWRGPRRLALAWRICWFARTDGDGPSDSLRQPAAGRCHFSSSILSDFSARSQPTPTIS